MGIIRYLTLILDTVESQVGAAITFHGFPPSQPGSVSLQPAAYRIEAFRVLRKILDQISLLSEVLILNELVVSSNRVLFRNKLARNDKYSNGAGRLGDRV